MFQRVHEQAVYANGLVLRVYVVQLEKDNEYNHK